MMPKSLKVGPYTYKIVVSDDILPEKLGQCKVDQLRILVAPDQAPMMQKDTLLHEVLHACCAAMNIRDTIPHEIEEDVVHRLATSLLGVLRDNTKFVEFLCD